MEISLIKKLFNNSGIKINQNYENIENEIILKKENNDKFVKYLKKYGINGVGNSYAENIWSCKNLEKIINKINSNRNRFEMFVDKEKKYKKKKYKNKIDIFDCYDSNISQNNNYVIGGFFNDIVNSIDKSIEFRLQYYIEKLNIKKGMNILCLQKDNNSIGKYISEKTNTLVTVLINTNSENKYFEKNHKNVNFIKLDRFSNFDFISNNKFDRIISLNFLESINKEQYSSFFMECQKKLNDKGYMVLTSIYKYKKDIFDIEPWFNSVFLDQMNIPIFNDIIDYSREHFQISAIENFSNSYCKTLKKNIEYFNTILKKKKSINKESIFEYKSIEFFLCSIYNLFLFKTLSFCDFYLFKNNKIYNHIELLKYGNGEKEKKFKMNSFTEYMCFDLCEKMLSQSEKSIFSILFRNYNEEKYLNSIILLLLCKTVQSLNYNIENHKNPNIEKYINNIEETLLLEKNIDCNFDVYDIVKYQFKYCKKSFLYLEKKKRDKIINVIKQIVNLYTVNKHILNYISDKNASIEHINTFSLSGKILFNGILEIITNINFEDKNSDFSIGILYFKSIYIKNLLIKNIIEKKKIKKIIIKSLNNVKEYIQYLESFNDENIINFLGSTLIITIGNLVNYYNTGLKKELDIKMLDNIITSSINIKNIKVWIRYFLEELIL